VSGYCRSCAYRPQKSEPGDFLTPEINSGTCSNVAMEAIIDLEILGEEPPRPLQALPMPDVDLEILGEEPPSKVLQALPMPDGRPVPLFFGRRFLTYQDLVAIGFVSNAMTLRRLIAEGRFPPPLELGRKLRLWDALELHALVERLAAARKGKEPAASETTGKSMRDDEQQKRAACRPLDTEHGGHRGPGGRDVVF
jgi:predicted DNA-binding transcriptional regulator AlpA